MDSLIQTYLNFGVLSFILVFVRVGAAFTIMPGIGDSFTPATIRLYIALGLSFILAPIVYKYLPPDIHVGPQFLIMVIMEFIVGLFIGTLARIMMAALDTAGMAISVMSGLGNAQLFNPAAATQGSLVGAILSVAGVLLVFVTDLHHLLIMGVINSYELFKIGTVPDTHDMAETITTFITRSFAIGIEIATPFMVIGMIIYIGMGVLARLMPQIQVFMLALPLQIMLAFVTLSIVISGSFLYWLNNFEDNMVTFLQAAGG